MMFSLKRFNSLMSYLFSSPFDSARLKLTAWYLLITMLISSFFSLFIYQLISAEIDRFAANQRFRIERRFGIQVVPLPPTFDDEIVSDAKNRLSLVLLGLNTGILFLSGALGYVLAGRTLKPIRSMLDEQSRFISDSSHELRTPLTALKSNLEVNLRDPHLRLKDAKVLIKESIQDVDNLTQLSNKLLKLARLEQDRNNLNLQSVDLKDILNKAIHQVAPLAKNKNITIDDLSFSSAVYIDPDQICDLFVILLDNAIKYSPDSSTVKIQSSRSDNHLDVSFTDQGIGISQKDIPHLFDRFFRADSSRTKTEIPGFGLGLSIAQKIAKANRSRITVESKLGEGAKFTIRLPLFS